MLSLFFACLIGLISVVSTLNIIPQDSITVSADSPTPPSNLLSLLSPSSQSTSWPNISFPPARPPSQAANESALKALGLDTDEPVYWETTPSGNILAVQCNTRYGRRLDYQDCRDAYRYLPRSDRRTARFAERHTDLPHDIAMPQRLLGSRGKCAINPVILEGYETATASPENVADAAYTLIERCAPRSGGIAVNIGGDDHLAVVLQPYYPSVRCEDSDVPLSRESCSHIERGMEADGRWRSFGYRSVDPEVEEPLPYDLMSADERCVVRISSTAGTDSERFYHFWEAIVALNAMCVRVGKKGTADRFGQQGTLNLKISNEPFDPPVAGAINVTATERI